MNFSVRPPATGACGSSVARFPCCTRKGDPLRPGALKLLLRDTGAILAALTGPLPEPGGRSGTIVTAGCATPIFMTAFHNLGSEGWVSPFSSASPTPTNIPGTARAGVHTLSQDLPLRKPNMPTGPNFSGSALYATTISRRAHSDVYGELVPSPDAHFQRQPFLRLADEDREPPASPIWRDSATARLPEARLTVGNSERPGAGTFFESDVLG